MSTYTLITPPHLEKISHQAVDSHLEDDRLWVFVDGDNCVKRNNTPLTDVEQKGVTNLWKKIFQILLARWNRV